MKAFLGFPCASERAPDPSSDRSGLQWRRLLSRVLLASLVWIGPLSAQNPVTSPYPAALPADSDLPPATNGWSSRLNGAINATVTTIAVDDASALTMPALLRILDPTNGDEYVLCASKSVNDLTSCTRDIADDLTGDGTGVSHDDNTLILAVMSAQHLNAAFSSIKALATLLGVNGNNVGEVAEANTWSLAQTFTVAPVFTALTGIVQGNGASAATAVTDSSTVGQVFRVTGASTYGWGAVDLADTDAVTGLLPSGNVATLLRTRQFVAKWWGTGGASVLQDADDEQSIWNNQLGSGITITEVCAESDAGTPTVQLQRDDDTPANILTANLTAGTTPACTTGFSGTENQIADGHRIDGLIVTAGGTAKWVSLTIVYTLD